MHWAAKRGHVDITTYLIRNGADIKLPNLKGETPLDLCTNPKIRAMLGGNETGDLTVSENSLKFNPHYLRNPPLNGHVDVGSYREFSSMPITSLPTDQDDGIIK